MYGCPDCQDRLLDHLYGLLEGAEQAEFLAHLNGCPACQAGMEAARAQQRLLAAAARLPLPPGRFERPANDAGPRPVLLPLRPGRPPSRRWATWAAAAAVLLALGGLSVPALTTRADYLARRERVEAAESAVAAARAAMKQAEAEAAALLKRRDGELARVTEEIRARELRLVVSGPRTLQPGAPAEFQVRATDLNGQPADALLDATLDGAPERTGFAAPGAAADAIPGPPAMAGPGGKAAGPARGADKAKKMVDREGGPRSVRLPIKQVDKGLYTVTVPPSLDLNAGRAVAMAVSARRRDKDEAREGLTLRGEVALTAPVYLTHLTTDKPIYQPGEAVRFRSLTLDRGTLTPPADDLRLRFVLTPPAGPPRAVGHGTTTLTGVNGAVANGPNGKPLRGVGAGEFVLEPGTPAGEYTLTASEDAGRFAPVTRKFVVNEYQKPRLDKKIDFNRPSYGPGDEVQAQATAKRADGGPLAGCPVQATLVVDGTALPAVNASTDPDGSAVVRFKLPATIQRGLASLSVNFEDAGTPEAVTRPVPVVLNKVEVEFFPEGGELVAGLPARVYFQARTPAGKPAQVSGTLLEDGKPTAVTLTTMSDDREQAVNQGLGSFAFTPKAGASYAVRVDSPKGIADRKPLPAVQPDGVTLRVDGGVFRPDEPIRVKVHSTKGRMFLIGAYCRETLLDSVTLEQGRTDAVLRPTSPAGGVCRVTVFEVLNTGGPQRTLRPRAERLVYRLPGTRLDVALTPGKRAYTPAARATLGLIATDENERPAAAVAQVAVVDGSVLTLADERTARTMPTHFLLATEVRRAEDLEYADFLIGQHPKAPAVLDLLLGTQGWRRFAEQNPGRFLEARRRAGSKDAQDAERLLVMIGQSEPIHADLDQARLEAVAADFEAKLEDISRQQVEAGERAEAAASAQEYRAALAALAGYARAWETARLVGLVAFSVLALLALALALRRSLQNVSGRAWAGGAVLAGAAAVLLALSQPVETPRPVAAADRREMAIAPPDAPPAMAMPVEDNPGTPMRGGIGGFGAAPLPPGMPAPKPGAAGAALGVPGRPLDRDRFRMAQVTRLAGAHDLRGGPRGTFGLEAERLRRGLERDRAPIIPRADMARGGEGGRAKADDRKALMEADMAAPLVAREYAHVRPEGLSLATRQDFAETVYWHPVLILPDGRADVSFQLPDSVTTFQVTAFAHTLDGRLGAAAARIESRLPLSVSPKLPLEVTSSDRLNVPVSVSSRLSEKQNVTVAVTEHGGLEVEEPKRHLEVPAEASRRVLVPVRPVIREGEASFAVTAGGDAARHTLRVVPDGFPVEKASSDLLEKSATHAVPLPGDLIPGTLKVRVDAYPSPLADLAKGLDGLLREPHGCFEQTSTTNYPNVLTLAFLRDQKKSSPVIEGRARGLLERGYKRLVSFECENPAQKSRQGFEWFGGTAPPHEALTAYGLLQFTDMAQVADVDAAMLARTRSFLLGRKDGKGGFRRNPKATDTFGRASEAITNAYIVWALTETGKDDLTLELSALTAQAAKTEDAYFLSLVALSLANVGKADDARALLGRVVKAQKPDGSLTAETSVTSSGGTDLAVETTALAVLAWLKADPVAYGKSVTGAVRWIGRQRQGGGAFGSTQATILALKAVLAHSKTSPRTIKEGTMTLFLGDREVGKARVPANAAAAISLEMTAPEELLKAGPNSLRVEMTPATNVMPHTLGWTYRVAKPAPEAAPLVKLTTALAKADVKEGESVRLTARVENVSGRTQGMVTAVIGLPAGLALPENLEQLRGYTRRPDDGTEPLVSAFEVSGRQVVLYWRSLAKGQAVEVPLDVVARVPGTYRGPASRAYPYYESRAKHWADPLAVTVRE